MTVKTSLSLATQEGHYMVAIGERCDHFGRAGPEYGVISW
jgi:hypothetical protein